MSIRQLLGPGAVHVLGAALAAALGLSLAACSSKKAEPTPAPADKPATAAAKAPAKPQADFSGVVRGLVKFAPDAELPLLPTPTEQIVNPAPPCAPYGESDRQVFKLAPETRGISPVHVAITQMSAVPDVAPAVRELRAEGCRLGPRLVAAKSGDTLRIANLSDNPVFPFLPGDSFMQSINKGQHRDMKLGRLGPMRVRCTVAGYCGDVTVITLSHPLFSVTDDKGEFVIKGVPLGQELTLHAAHPLIGVTSAKFKVTKEQPEAKVELVLAPRVPTPPPAAPAPEPEKAGDKPEKAGDKPAKAGDKPAKKAKPEPVVQ